jgi:uncharacterized damage-inducible protein DinB
MLKHSFITLALLALCAMSGLAQSAKPADTRPLIVREQEKTWQRARKWTLDYIDAMLAEAMSFKATPDVRSFAEQMLHLAFWNYGLIEAGGGKASPYGKDQKTLEARKDLQTKTELRKTVEASYDYVLAFISTLDEAKLLEAATFFNSKMTRLSILSLALDHQTHHRGQTTTYLRLKGVTPPPEP